MRDFSLEPGEIAPRTMHEHSKSSRREKRLRRSRSPRRGLSFKEREAERRRTRSPKSRRKEERKKTKKHKRHRHEAKVDMDVDSVLPRSDSEEIEERRKRIAAIKNKHQKLAQAQKSPEVPETEIPGSLEGTAESVSSAECAFVEKEVLHGNSEVEIDANKSCASIDRADCSADRREILNDERHDKEKLLNDQQPRQMDEMELDDIFCDTPDEGSSKKYLGLDNAVKKAVSQDSITGCECVDL